MIQCLRRFFRPIPREALPDLAPALLAGVQVPCVLLVVLGSLVSLVHVFSGSFDLAGVVTITALGQPLFWGCLALTFTKWGRRRPELLLLALAALVNVFSCFTGVQAPDRESPISLFLLVSPLTVASFAPWPPTIPLLSAGLAIVAWLTGARFAPGVPAVDAPLAVLIAGSAGAIAACACQAQRLVWADLQRARREASAGQQAKAEFLAAMSHEIRTPMTAILGYTDELVQNAERGLVAPLATLETIKRNGARLLGLLDDILDLVRVEAGRVDLSIEPCSPAAIVAAVAERAAEAAAAKGLQIEIDVGPAVPREVLSDAAHVRQILHALVGNAIKFTEQGEVRVRVRREPDPSGADEYLVFDVLDTGIGLGPTALRRLFEPFTQVDGSMRRRFGGAGVGLALAQKLAQALGGEISAAPRPGGGSVFQLAVPLRIHGAARAVDSPRSSARELGGRVLLAEDGEDNRVLITRILQRAGVSVDLAENGREAHAKAMSALLSGTPYDVVLMDMQMPEMTGDDAARALRADGYDAPIVALTAQALGGDRSSCLAAGCDDYATKPIDRETLLGLVARFLEKNAGG